MAEIQLTPQQRLAVDCDGGELLVSAAAGSGKTKVLVDRVMRRICDENEPQNINRFLIITYTRAAASELRAKIAAAISKRLAQHPENRHLQRQLSLIYLAQISTVHSFCMNILRDYAHELGIYPDFRIADETETALWMEQAIEQTLAAAYEDLEASPDRRAFLDHLGAGRDDRGAAVILMQAYRSVQCHPDPQEWIGKCLRSLELEHCTDMADTPWGRHLMQAFACLLDEQIQSMERGLARLSENEAVQEKYGPTYQENLAQLRQLRQLETWDALYHGRIRDFGRFKPVSGLDNEEKERFRRPREQCKKLVGKAQSVFSMSSQEALEELRSCAPVIRGMIELLQDFTAHYRAIKQRRRAMDYNDLEHEALRLLCEPGTGEPTPAAKEIRARYCEIMVDEYQDSNAVQDRIFSAVSQDGTNLFMVGDVKQSIYRFRMADPGIFLRKYQTFSDAAVAAPGVPRRVMLSNNFRSRAQILSAVNDIFSLCMSPEVGEIRYSAQERLLPGLTMEPAAQPCVELHCIDTGDADGDKYEPEARLVATRIAGLLRDGAPVRDGGTLRPVAASDIVILLRAMSAQAGIYLKALADQGIRAVSDQSDDILKTTEVSVLLSYLQILDNPHQDISLLSVLLSPMYGFDAETVAQMRVACRSGDCYDAIAAYSAEHGEFSDFLQQYQELRQVSLRRSVGVLVRTVLDKTRLSDVFCAMEDGQRRLENLQTIYLLASRFDPDGPGRLHDFLSHIERMRERGIPGGETSAKNAVRLMSIHKSKGLEFPVVIVAGLSRQFNREDDRRPVQIHPELGMGADVVDLRRRVKYSSLAKQAVLARQRSERLSEELRVLYVALTRPKDLLIMTYASAHLQSELQAISDQLTPDGPVSLSRSARCLGHWVLMAAMRRGEAGQLFDLGGKPDETVVLPDPWLIRLWTTTQLPEVRTGRTMTEEAPETHNTDAEKWIAFHYPHAAATTFPAKMTATQFKGRDLDEESMDHTPPAKSREPALRQPLFLRGARPLSPMEQGTAVHLAMQYIRYEKCLTQQGVAAELARLTEEGFLLAGQVQCVRPEKITALFSSELGRRILRAPEVVREFKFSILVDAGQQDPALAGEKLMLQGVTDCCLLEDDGLCVIDFKTDRVVPGEERARAEHYRGQLAAYSEALSRIFLRPVKERCLYFFATDTAVFLK